MRNDLSLQQTIDLIAAIGARRTVLVQGHMGTGKSSILKALAKRFPNHAPCYFDCTTKDLGDITLPRIAAADGNDGAYVSYATNEELGAHLHRPIILMVDELGKSNPAVKLALLRLMLERAIGSYTLHPDSIIFATTNLGAEGVGDLLLAHARNRLTVVSMRKSTPDEWFDWGVDAGIHPTVLGWVHDTPSLFADFRDIQNPEENPHIFHPASPRAAFVTGRSLEAASDILHSVQAGTESQCVDEPTLLAALAGTIGTAGAADLMAFVKLSGDLPRIVDIIRDPLTARVPKKPAAICLVVSKALQSMSDEFIDPWMQYMTRLPSEAQAMFAASARRDKYSKRGIVFTNAAFGKWCFENNYLFQ